jgi:hypothetical protein
MGRPYFRGAALLAGVLLLGAVGVTAFQYARDDRTSGSAAAAAAPRTGLALTYADRMGTHYTAIPPDLTLPPRVKEIPIEIRLDSIWGGTGRDVSGHIWVGASDRDSGGSAHLLEYAPESGVMTDHGDVVSELKEAGVYRQGEGQIKLHTKIVQGEDGYLYFASFDEEGEDPAAGLVSKWGGHFWRYKPGNPHWEHIRSVPQALVAVAGNANWMYALGYWDHVLFQYDTRKKTWRQVKVGSVREHVSRNIVVDRHGHAYVPRARELRPGEKAAGEGQEFAAELVEFDTDLKEVGSTPLAYYAERHNSHGLIGLSYLEDGSILVSTHIGYLYRITPSDTGAATVEAVGWIHPKGGSYPASLFPIDGKRYLAAVVQVEGGFDWIVYDLLNKQSRAQRLTLKPAYRLLYGSSTRDNQGRFYVVGQQDGPDGHRPLMLQVEMQN